MLPGALSRAVYRAGESTNCSRRITATQGIVGPQTPRPQRTMIALSGMPVDEFMARGGSVIADNMIASVTDWAASGEFTNMDFLTTQTSPNGLYATSDMEELL